MTGTAIVVESLTKIYANGTRALDAIDLEVGKDEILCLAGPNAAGKTTALRILGTQLLPTSGSVRVLGLDAIEDANRVRPHLAVVPQEAAPDPELKVWEHVYYYLLARGLRRSEARSRAEQALRAMDLWERRDQLVYNLSGGQRRRVLIAMAVASRAEILLLDEPTTGLDPVARREAWATLLELKTSRSILLTTHSMEEAEALADRVAIVNQGRIAALGTVAELRLQLSAKQKVYLSNGIDRDDLARFGEVDSFGGKVVVYPRDKKAREELLDVALSSKQEASVSSTTLEDVYLSIMRGVS